MSDRLIEVDDSTLVDPDDWAFAEPKNTSLSLSEELQRQVDEFLAQGGQVKEVPMGASGVPDTHYLWSFPVGKAADPAKVEHVQADPLRRKAQTLSQKRGTEARRGVKHSDAELVVMIDTLLGAVKTKKELCDKLGCSDSLLQRLLFCHYGSDKRADPFRHESRGDREARHLRALRQCVKEGHTDMQVIVQLTGIRRTTAIELNRRFMLGILPGKPGRKGTIACNNQLCHALVTTVAKFCPQCGTITALGVKESARDSV